MHYAGTPDPRRRPQPPPTPAISRGLLPPQIVQPDHVSAHGLDVTSVRFDSASFNFLLGQVGPYTVNVATGAWKRVGLGGGLDVQAHIGPTDRELYVWVWGSFGWANGSGTADHGQFTAALYKDNVTYQRATNVASQWLPSDGNFRECIYLGFFLVPIVEGADWSVGLQHQFSAAGHSSQTVNRQSIIAFVSSAPDDAANNTASVIGGDSE